MTNNDDDTPLDTALDAVEDFDEEMDLDPHLKRAFRHLTIGTEQLRKAMQKRGLLPIGKH